LTSIIRQLRLLLLGLWLGAAVFFGAAVAPALFNVLRGAGLGNANELAGSMVTRLLGIINQGGLEIALFLFVTSFFVNRNQSRLARWAEVISLAIMAIMTGVSHWVISARMLELRRAMGAPIDQVSPIDPRRMSFDSLHRYSVMVMSIAMIAGLVAFVLASRPGRRDSRS
jgi:ABC-type transport system involved in cytochrome bd biosynthesis fused ATPase/permease subunit